MKKNYWFKAKQYGWGWYPATWEGWSVIAIFVAANLLIFYKIDEKSHSASDTLLNYIPFALAFIFALIGTCYYTGEKPSWHWGNKKKKS